MSTITPTPETETEPALTLPDDLWRAFRRERRMGSSQRESISHALERSAFQKQDSRERLADLLIAREAERGLTLTEEEHEAEILAESGGIADVPVEPEPGSAAAVRADAAKRLAELEEQDLRLAPLAVTDPKIKQEWLDVQSEKSACRTEMELADKSETQTARLEREAIEEAASAAAVAAEVEAAKLQPQIAKAAQRVDTAANVFAESVTAFRDLREAQAGALARTPRGAEAVRARQYKPARVSEALSVALRERGVKIEGVVGSARDEPLAATEPTKL